LRLFDGVARLTVAPRPPFRKGARYRWSINAENGLPLGAAGTFYASMNFEVVDSVPADHDDEHQGEYRCSTRGYNYKLTTARGADLWRLHWHPEGDSPWASSPDEPRG